MSDVTAIKLVSLAKLRADGTNAFDNISLEFKEGSYISIMQRTSRDNFTLLNLIGALEVPSSGWVEVFGRRVHTMVNPDLFRAKEIGFVFKQSVLIPVLSVVDNILIPSHALPSSKTRAKKQAHELLELVGLSHKKDSLPNELEPGERQLVTVARALINDPRIVLAYEPTGLVDKVTAEKIFNIINEIRSKTYTTFVIATGEQPVADRTEIMVSMENGAVNILGGQ